MLQCFTHGGFTIGRALHLDGQWCTIVSRGPVGVLDWDTLVRCPNFGLDGFRETVADSINEITEFVQWVLEDRLVHPYRWPRPDNIPPAPFLSCDPQDSVDGPGVPVDPHDIDRYFRKAWLPFFCQGAKGRDSDVHIFAADVVKSFDTVDRGVLCAGPIGVAGLVQTCLL